MKLITKIAMIVICAVFFIVLFVINDSIKANYKKRLTHVNSIEFMIGNYYYDNKKLPSELSDLEPWWQNLKKPFNGNLELIIENNERAILREREKRHSSLFVKQRISLVISAKKYQDQLLHSGNKNKSQMN